MLTKVTEDNIEQDGIFLLVRLHLLLDVITLTVQTSQPVPSPPSIERLTQSRDGLRSKHS